MDNKPQSIENKSPQSEQKQEYIYLSSFFNKQNIVYIKKKLPDNTIIWNMGKSYPQKMSLPCETVTKTDNLIFESKFECGNLFLASHISQNEYNLIL